MQQFALWLQTTALSYKHVNSVFYKENHLNQMYILLTEFSLKKYAYTFFDNYMYACISILNNFL